MISVGSTGDKTYIASLKCKQQSSLRYYFLVVHGNPMEVSRAFESSHGSDFYSLPNEARLAIDSWL